MKRERADPRGKQDPPDHVLPIYAHLSRSEEIRDQYDRRDLTLFVLRLEIRSHCSLAEEQPGRRSSRHTSSAMSRAGWNPPSIITPTPWLFETRTTKGRLGGFPSPCEPNQRVSRTTPCTHYIPFPPCRLRQSSHLISVPPFTHATRIGRNAIPPPACVCVPLPNR